MTAQPLNRLLTAASLVRNASLEDKLRAIGIEPLDTATVEAHMERERAAVPYTRGATVLQPALAWFHSHICQLYTASLICVLAGLCVAFLSYMITSYFWGWDFPSNTGALVPGVFLSGIAILVLMAAKMLEMERITVLMPAQWQAVDPSSTDAVLTNAPPEIQRVARLVKVNFPDTRLIVHQLCQEGYIFDPVLEVADADERAYIGVWDGDVIVDLVQIG